MPLVSSLYPWPVILIFHCRADVSEVNCCITLKSRGLTCSLFLLSGSSVSPAYLILTQPFAGFLPAVVYFIAHPPPQTPSARLSLPREMCLPCGMCRILSHRGRLLSNRGSHIDNESNLVLSLRLYLALLNSCVRCIGISRTSYMT